MRAQGQPYPRPIGSRRGRVGWAGWLRTWVALWCCLVMPSRGAGQTAETSAPQSLDAAAPAEDAMAQLAREVAQGQYLQALTRYAGLPEPQQRTLAAVVLRGQCLHGLGRRAEAVDVSREAWRLAEPTTRGSDWRVDAATLLATVLAGAESTYSEADRLFDEAESELGVLLHGDELRRARCGLLAQRTLQALQQERLTHVEVLLGKMEPEMRLSEVDEAAAQLWDVKGRWHLALAQFKEAESAWREAIRRLPAERPGTPGDAALAARRAMYQGHRGLALHRQGDLRASRSVLQAIEQLEGLGQKVEAASFHQAMALIEAERGQLSQALERQKGVCALYEGQPQLLAAQASAWQVRAGLAEQAGLFQEAMDSAETALRRAEQAQIPPQNVLWLQAWRVLWPAAHRLGAKEKALAASRQVSHRALAALSNTMDLQGGEGSAASRRLLNVLNAAYSEPSLSAPGGVVLAADLTVSSFGLLTERARGAKPAGAAPVTAAMLSQSLPKDAALIVLTLNDVLSSTSARPPSEDRGSVCGLLIQAEQVPQVLPSLASSQELAEWLEQVRPYRSTVLNRVALNDAEAIKSGLKALHQRLWLPLMARLGVVSRLYVCLEGALAYVPLDFLSMGLDSGEAASGQKKTPQIIRLAHPRCLLTQRSQAPQTGTESLIIDAGRLVPSTGAAPSPDPGVTHRQLPFPFGERVAEVLPMAATEAALVHKSRPGSHLLTVAAKAEALVKSRFTPRLGHLHFIGHALVRNEEGNVSVEWDRTACLVLPGLALGTEPQPAAAQQALSPSPAIEDECLFTQEIAECSLSGAELVYLSTCLAGRGASLHGEAPWGLVRAFHAAGARDVLCAAHPIEDMAAQRLADLFYARWSPSVEAPEALAAAQRALWSELWVPGGDFAHAYAQVASFFLVRGR